MRCTTASLAGLVLALPALINAQAIIQTPPSVVQCQPVAVTFSGGQGPYFISVLPGGQTGAAPLQTFPTQNQAGSYTWTCNIPAGTSISFQIRDGSGNLNYSDMTTVQPSSDTSCLGTNASISQASSAASSIASSAASAVSSISSSVASQISSANSVASSAASSITNAATSAVVSATSTPPASTPNGAATKVGAVGQFVVAVGAVAAAVAVFA